LDSGAVITVSYICSMLVNVHSSVGFGVVLSRTPNAT